MEMWWKMKVKFSCNSGANIHSTRSSGWISFDETMYTEEEWKALSEEEKYKAAEQWAWEHGLEIWFEEELETEDG